MAILKQNWFCPVFYLCIHTFRLGSFTFLCYLAFEKL